MQGKKTKREKGEGYEVEKGRTRIFLDCEMESRKGMRGEEEPLFFFCYFEAVCAAISDTE